MVLNSSQDTAARKQPPNTGSGRAASFHSCRSWHVWVERRLATATPPCLQGSRGSVLQWKVPEILNFCWDVAGFLSVLLCAYWFLRAALRYSPPCPLVHVGSLSALFGCACGEGFCSFAAPVWDRAGCPALCRVRLPLDVGEEVEQHIPEGSDSAFSLL